MLHLFHKWKTVYKNGKREVQECSKCRKRRSTVYDMTYGETVWADNDWWSYRTE